MRKLFVVLVCFLGAVCLAQSAEPPVSGLDEMRPKTASSELPNIIFMLTDDLGYSDIGCYGATTVKHAVLEPKVSTEQRILFPASTTKRFIKFQVTDAVSFGGQSLAAVGELDVVVK